MPREGHDAITASGLSYGLDISIHVPREGHDHLMDYDKLIESLDFYPRAP